MKKFSIRSLDGVHSLADAIRNSGIESGHWRVTPFIRDINPFNQEILEAKKVLDIGCGPGRHLNYFMTKTNAHYIGLEPPDSKMLPHFWSAQEHFRPGSKEKYKDRVTLCTDFDELPDEIDLVVCTFVFQHFEPETNHLMGPTEIAKKVMEHTTKDCVWVLIEHERQDPGWQSRWLNDIGIKSATIKRTSELFHDRDFNFIAFKENKDETK